MADAAMKRGAGVAAVVLAVMASLAFGPWDEPPAWAEPAELAPVNEREARRDTTGLAQALLRGSSPSLRGSAARALGRIQNRGSVPALTAALTDRSAAVRFEAAFALALVGDSTAAAAIAARIPVEPDSAARTALITALGYLGARRESPALEKALASRRAGDRWAAALAAGRARDSSLVAPLAAAARDSRAETRWRAAYALGRIGDRRAGPALRALLGDKDASVRAAAARAVGDVGDSAAAPQLVKLLLDKAWRVRVNAAHALGVLKTQGAASPLRALLRDPSPHVRWEGAIALGAVRDSGAIAPLTAALGDTATGVVQGAAIALLQIQGDAAVPRIAPALDLLPPFLRSGLIDAMGDLPGPESPASLEILLARVRRPNEPALAAGAASALGRRAADRRAAIPVLRGALEANDFAVASSAAEALGALGDSTAVPALTRLLKRSGRRPAPEEADVAASAATALAALKTPAALESLRAARRDPERRIRETATVALGLPRDSVAAEPAPPLRVDAIPAKPARQATVFTDRGSFRITLHPQSAPR